MTRLSCIVIVLAVSVAMAVSSVSASTGFYVGSVYHTGGQMQDIYGFGYRAGLTYGRQLQPDLDLKIDLEAQLAADSSFSKGMRIWTGSLIPSLNKTIVGHEGGARIQFGVGIGLSDRMVTATVLVADSIGGFAGRKSVTYHDTSLPVLVRLNFVIPLGSTTSLIPHFRYTYHNIMTGEPERGDLGNTGGISFNLGLEF